jgi:hypothetical protein
LLTCLKFKTLSSVFTTYNPLSALGYQVENLHISSMILYNAFYSYCLQNLDTTDVDRLHKPLYLEDMWGEKTSAQGTSKTLSSIAKSLTL